MSQVDWLSILGWNKDELEDLRFVGYSYIKQGKYDIAITFFEALTILSPDSVYDLQTLGALYLQKGNNLMALNYIEKAIKLDAYPPSHSAQSHKSSFCVRLQTASAFSSARIGKMP